MYYKFNLSHCCIEDLLAERGITVSHESIRLWCIKFGIKYTRRLKRKHRGYGYTSYLNEVVDLFLQAKRDGVAAKCFFRRLLNYGGGEPRRVVTDKLRSYNAAHRELMSDVIHYTSQYANNK